MDKFQKHVKPVDKVMLTIDLSTCLYKAVSLVNHPLDDPFGNEAKHSKC
jgi:hypothetical protein